MTNPNLKYLHRRFVSSSRHPVFKNQNHRRTGSSRDPGKGFVKRRTNHGSPDIESNPRVGIIPDETSYSKPN